MRLGDDKGHDQGGQDRVDQKEPSGKVGIDHKMRQLINCVNVIGIKPKIRELMMNMIKIYIAIYLLFQTSKST